MLLCYSREILDMSLTNTHYNETALRLWQWWNAHMRGVVQYWFWSKRNRLSSPLSMHASRTHVDPTVGPGQSAAPSKWPTSLPLLPDIHAAPLKVFLLQVQDSVVLVWQANQTRHPQFCLPMRVHCLRQGQIGVRTAVSAALISGQQVHNSSAPAALAASVAPMPPPVQTSWPSHSSSRSGNVVPRNINSGGFPGSDKSDTAYSAWLASHALPHFLVLSCST